jgi:hypothetical protein
MTVNRLDESYASLDAAHRAGETLSADDLWGLSVRAGRNHYPALLLIAAIYEVIAADTITALVADAWCAAEFPQDCLRRADWLWLFGKAGYTVNGKPAGRPAEPVRLWRGSSPGLRRRWSWTSDPERAEWFASRCRLFGQAAQVWQVEAPPASLLAAMFGPDYRNESQYVVSTAGLKITEAA